ncbi:MAG TPA: helix-turn-helix domain-containing protein [Candidatus Saccharimonadales bacterium]|nr:helix-turn-helix domain-containing protein [Candidatus Saccharimonadales bacterium]
MKKSRLSPRRHAPRTRASQRAQLVALFDRSGLSATAFARRHGLNYTTFCGWRQKTKAGLSPRFVQIDLPAPTTRVELVIELGAFARLRLTAQEQIPMAARLLQTLDTQSPC